MRWLPLAIAAALLAGCNSDPDSPTDGGSFGATGSSGTSSSGPPVANHTSSMTSSTTAATATSAAPSPSGPRFAGHHEEQSASDADFPGLSVSGQLSGGGERVSVEASAVNFGGRMYRVSNVCIEPWTENASGPSGPVQMRPPAASCQGFGLRDFGPGQSLPYSGAWDGTVWAGDRFVAAPAGQYMWTLTFTVYSGGSGTQYNDVAHLRLPFNVTVA